MSQWKVMKEKALPQLQNLKTNRWSLKVAEIFRLVYRPIEFVKQKSGREATNYIQFRCHGDSVRVLLEPGFQGHWYFQIVNAVNSNDASEGEAAVFLERAHAHQSWDGIRQLAVSSTDVDAAPYQLLDGTGAAVSVMSEHKPSIAVRDSRVYLQPTVQVYWTIDIHILAVSHIQVNVLMCFCASDSTVRYTSVFIVLYCIVLYCIVLYFFAH